MGSRRTRSDRKAMKEQWNEYREKSEKSPQLRLDEINYLNHFLKNYKPKDLNSSVTNKV